MAKTVIVSHDDDRDDITNIEDLDLLSCEEIAERFNRSIEQIYLKVAEAAFLLLALEKRPEAAEIVRKLRRRPIVEAVRNVGIGTLIKEAFADYYGRPDVLRVMTALPIDRQRELVRVGAVAVYDHLDNEHTHRMISIGDLTAQELSLVFDVKDRRVREPIEQAKLLASRRLREKMIRPEISYDERTGVLNCKNATPAEIQEYIKKHGLS